MGRGANQIGWTAQDTNTPVTPSELNDVYSFGQFWIPAGALTPVTGFPGIIETLDSTGETPAHNSWTVMKMANAVKSGGNFTWAFKSDFMAGTTATLLLRTAPIFISKVNADPAVNIVEWSLGAVNLAMGDDINFDANTETVLLSTVQPVGTTAGEFLINGGDASSKQNVPLTLINNTVSGTSDISGTDWNFCTINVEREAETASRVADTYLSDVFLLGVGVQFAVDFNNVAVWP